MCLWRVSQSHRRSVDGANGSDSAPFGVGVKNMGLRVRTTGRHRLKLGNCARFACVLFCAMAAQKHCSKILCHCGCGGSTEGGRYLLIHDAKYKVVQTHAACKGCKCAANKLRKLGWAKFLETARATSSAA